MFTLWNDHTLCNKCFCSGIGSCSVDFLIDLNCTIICDRSMIDQCSIRTNGSIVHKLYPLWYCQRFIFFHCHYIIFRYSHILFHISDCDGLIVTIFHNTTIISKGWTDQIHFFRSCFFPESCRQQTTIHCHLIGQPSK